MAFYGHINRHCTQALHTGRGDCMWRTGAEGLCLPFHLDASSVVIAPFPCRFCILPRPASDRRCAIKLYRD